MARDTWRYFERVVTAGDHHLPPANLQSAPHEMLARRTSPTNIGLYLLSGACARQFGGVATLERLLRLRARFRRSSFLARATGARAPFRPRSF